MRALALGLVCGLSACAQHGLQPYVTPLSEEAAARMAFDITAFVVQQVPPATGSSISVLRAPGDVVLWPKLSEDLHAGGYTVVTEGHAQHQLRFEVATLTDGSFMRATLDGVSMAQPYHTFDGRIEQSGPATLLSEAE